MFGLKQGNVATFGCNVATFGCNVATFQRGNLPTSRSSGQSRGVPEDGNNQCRDVGYQRRNVSEGCKINVVTLDNNVATLQRRANPMSRHGYPTSRSLRVKSTSRHCDLTSRRDREGPKCTFLQSWSEIRENSPRVIMTLWTFVVLCMNGSSSVPSIASPESKHPKRNSDYGQKHQTNIT